jgi:hypothetical protein
LRAIAAARLGRSPTASWNGWCPAIPDANGPAWDALQIHQAEGQVIVISAFQSDSGSGRVTIAPHDLDPSSTYDVEPAATGALGPWTGADLMTGGIDLDMLAGSAAHLLHLTQHAAAENVRQEAPPPPALSWTRR